jgi:hydrogenase maturation protein HypF
MSTSASGAGADADRGELLRIAGVVQGVGFRYSAERLAQQHGVRGWVANIGRGVVIHACAPAERLERYVRALQEEIGPPARVDSVQREPAELLPADAGFRIAPSA